jgi:benzoate/toluate 1,2-dioxygenase beta subunit
MRDPLERLVLAEARLLDARDFAAWVALFTDDCHYWVPASPRMADPYAGPSHFNDDRQLMLARTHRLAHPRSFAAEPAPRTVHVVSGVEILAQTEGDAEVASSQIMLEWRQRDGFEADQRLFGGEVRHRLRKVGPDWRIAAKRIDLVNAEGSMAALLSLF